MQVCFDAIYAECNNQFVDIKYNSATSTITCTFLNSSDNSEKICSVEYGHNNKRMTIAANSTSNTVTLELSLDPSNGNYWFVVTASNGTHTVMVEGNIGTCTSLNTTLLILHYRYCHCCS